MQQQHDDVGNHRRHLLDYFPHQCATETVHWNAYERHLRLHPDEASDVDESFGLTALNYVVCVLNPPAPLRVVQRTYESYPDALLATTTERNDVERNGGDDEEHAVRCCSNTVLHMAIRENPHITSDVVAFLLDKQPSAVSTIDAAGYLPLHYVKSASVARVLINAYPQALETRRQSFFDHNHHADNNNFDDDVGETPLECALHENGSGPVSSEVVQTLIEEGYTRAETLFGGNCRNHGGGVLVKPKRKGGVSPLEYVCALTSRWERSAEEEEPSSSESVGGGTSSSPLPSSAPVSASVPSDPCHGLNDNSGKEEEDDDIKLWNNLTYIVQAAYSARKGYSTVASTVAALHCMVGLRLPIDLLTNVLSYKPNQIAIKDGARGRLPLHVACETPRTPLNVLKLLLTLYSKGASQADGTGRLPLHLAVECGISYDEGIQLLVETEKRAVGTMDVTRQGMYPFMMAAMGKKKKKKKKRQGCLDSVYALLREVPYLVS